VLTPRTASRLPSIGNRAQGRFGNADSPSASTSPNTAGSARRCTTRA
jgi:hypothetical protein